MSNTNLPNFNNIYANLAESAYTDRPKSFAQTVTKMCYTGY